MFLMRDYLIRSTNQPLCSGSKISVTSQLVCLPFSPPGLPDFRVPLFLFFPVSFVQGILSLSVLVLSVFEAFPIPFLEELHTLSFQAEAFQFSAQLGLSFFQVSQASASLFEVFLISLWEGLYLLSVQLEVPVSPSSSRPGLYLSLA